jgi:hypothetical protein
MPLPCVEKNIITFFLKEKGQAFWRKSSKIVENLQKLSKIVENCRKSSKIGENRRQS